MFGSRGPRVFGQGHCFGPSGPTHRSNGQIHWPGFWVNWPFSRTFWEEGRDCSSIPSRPKPYKTSPCWFLEVGWWSAWLSGIAFGWPASPEYHCTKRGSWRNFLVSRRPFRWFDSRSPRFSRGRRTDAHLFIQTFLDFQGFGRVVPDWKSLHHDRNAPLFQKALIILLVIETLCLRGECIKSTRYSSSKHRLLKTPVRICDPRQRKLICSLSAG